MALQPTVGKPLEAYSFSFKFAAFLVDSEPARKTFTGVNVYVNPVIALQYHPYVTDDPLVLVYSNVLRILDAKQWVQRPISIYQVKNREPVEWKTGDFVFIEGTVDVLAWQEYQSIVPAFQFYGFRPIYGFDEVNDGFGSR